MFSIFSVSFLLNYPSSRRCVFCEVCGVTTPGVNSSWQANYSRCSTCHSLSVCPVCEDSYHSDDMIIQCENCQRWLHMGCEGLHGDEDADRALDSGYHCSICRPLTGRSVSGAIVAPPLPLPPLPPPLLPPVPATADPDPQVLRVKVEPGTTPVVVSATSAIGEDIAGVPGTADALVPISGLFKFYVYFH